MTEPKHICHECGEAIEDGQDCMTIREKPTERLVYIAHRECIRDSATFRKLATE